MRLFLKSFLIISFFVLGFQAWSQISTSKISIHLINDYTVGSSNIVAGKPRTLKVLGLDSGFPSGMVAAMRDYKAKVPTGKIVVRVYSPTSYSLADNATLSAGDFWTNILQQSLNSISASDRALIDYLEGPNEGQTPTLGYPGNVPLQASQWFNQFWTNLTPRIVAAGYKPCIGSIAVGNPGGSVPEMQSYLAAFVPALRQAQAAGGAWSYHAYTINYTTDTNEEFYYSLRHRQFYNYFASAFPDLNSLPLILTEGGVDFSGDPNTSGWQARGSQADYQRWLNWFDKQLQQDNYLIGCTLFENGDPGGWSSFEVEPIANWLKNYLITPITLPPAPTSLSAIAGNGSVTLSWTNAPLTPTTWTVKRATNSGGLFFTIATNISTGVLATTFTDTSVSNFMTYFYVVNAVNAFGESTNSISVSATPIGQIPAAINCGGPAVGNFLADVYFNAGTAFLTSTNIVTNGVANAAPPAVYQAQRYGNLTYTLPYLTPNASYKVRLHFAEVYWNASGQRRFNVLVNGLQVLTNFDIFAAAGANFKANVQDFNAISDKNGIIAVQLATVTDNAAINGIELFTNATNSIPAAPTNFAATVGNAVVNLTWNVPSGAMSFSLKRSTVSGGPYSVIASNLTQGFFQNTSFTPNTTYYYVVSALNVLGESANSAQVSARPTNGLPDVIVTAVNWSPTNLFNGTHAVFSATVLNRGSASTPGGVTLGVGFNVDGGGTTSWSVNHSSALPPNSSVTLTANGGPLGVNYWTATPGSHMVTANVDDINRFPESLEDNNVMTVPLAVFATNFAFNSGGGAAGSFATDGNFVGSANIFSTTNAIDTSGASNAAPATVYQSERWGEFAYLLNNLVPGSNYTVRLHFAEISPSVNTTGQRRFNVLVNGIQALTDFDVFATAGAKFRAVTVEIKKRADDSGTILVQFNRGSVNEPKCSGIEVFGSAPNLQAPQISNCSLTNGVATLTWLTSPATIYRVQFKNDLNETNWTTLGNDLVASGNSILITNSVSGAARRFYRIVQIN